jgi:hypothetical protein
MQHHILIDLYASAETMVAELTAITKIADPGSAIAILAKHSLAIANEMNNDLSCMVDEAAPASLSLTRANELHERRKARRSRRKV